MYIYTEGSYEISYVHFNDFFVVMRNLEVFVEVLVSYKSLL